MNIKTKFNYLISYFLLSFVFHLGGWGWTGKRGVVPMFHTDTKLSCPGLIMFALYEGLLFKVMKKAI